MADAAEELRRLYLQREQVCLAGRVADEAVVRGDASARIEAERLFAELHRIDLAINRLEAGNDTKH
ncbi:hypothetical protein [Sphingobium ummariense]|uniref:Uncharacterized protein n=1 Tax=Sphingobium ummariense RL-3 TaxID=1346791 RepID=T0IWJ5_9SPHN|nr:hypothetical protein [Sphingobium ummariense]EQB30131.1 hypothetical protein M529_21405 [Sphingobium ummariense RL-3]